jgi:hypothetical protein
MIKKKPSLFWRIGAWLLKGVLSIVGFIVSILILLSALLGSWIFGVLSFYFGVELYQHWGSISAVVALKFAGSFVAFLACYIFIQKVSPVTQTVTLSASDKLMLALRR